MLTILDIIHIDFGFMLSNSPGSIGFEMAPFKLTQEYVDVLGGTDSPKFQEFRTLCKKAFQGILTLPLPVPGMRSC